MRKQLVNSVDKLLDTNNNVVLLLCDIGVFGFKNSFIKHPKRVYNIGILEQSTISLASGMAISGLIPIVHTIAPFLVERALEQLKIDFGYQELNGNFISVGASYDYASLGCTHHCAGDVAQLLTIPNMEIILPGTSDEFNSLLNQTHNDGKPTYIRLSEYENKFNNEVVFGKANVLKRGKKATVICVGNLLDNVLTATNDMDVTVLYYTTIKPFDSETLLENSNETIIIIEPYYEGAINYMVSKTLKNIAHKIINIGVPHKFLTNYGTKKEHDVFLNLDSESIRKTIMNNL